MSKHWVRKKGKNHNPLPTKNVGCEPWRFHCACGVQCSSDEPADKHPTGEMFECTSCLSWSHTACSIDEDVDAMNVCEQDDHEEATRYCFKCKLTDSGFHHNIKSPIIPRSDTRCRTF
jgi:hypothetical protein